MYACTFRRNEQLERLLGTLRVAADAVSDQAAVGIVIVDDNPDGRAKSVAEAWDERFELGVGYRQSGLGNISLARNLGLEAGAERGEWVAMTDDDCEVSPQWLAESLRVVRSFDADAVTGPHVRRAPTDAPSWLRDHPFLEHGDEEYPSDGAEPSHGQTNNSMIASSFLREHPEVRFDPGLGKLGGEDVVFYHQAKDAGLRLVFAHDAIVYEDAEGSRLTKRYYLRAALWFGNTMYVTSERIEGLGRRRGLLRAVKRFALALVHPVRRIASRRFARTRVHRLLLSPRRSGWRSAVRSDDESSTRHDRGVGAPVRNGTTTTVRHARRLVRRERDRVRVRVVADHRAECRCCSW
ncbi:MAG: glycosyltransferase [Ilumatobacteraceae bacterium]